MSNIYLPSIFSVHVETASPRRFVALHVYIAESSALSAFIDRVTRPKSNVLLRRVPEQRYYLHNIKY